MLFDDFAVRGTGGGLAGDSIDEEVERLGEGGAALHVVIADEAEDVALGEDGEVIVD